MFENQGQIVSGMSNRLYNAEHKELSRVPWISSAYDKILAEMSVIQNKNFRSSYNIL